METNTANASSPVLQMPQLPRTDEGRRMCQVIKVKPEALDEYKRVHAEVWPEVLGALRKANVVDYSIHYFEPLSLLIAHMRYVGPHAEFRKKMQEISENEATRRWWKMTDGMQESFIPGATGSEDPKGWWSGAEEVFRMEG
ncbi:rhamnose mutarotase [Kockovaella imperatae]|uniref:Rhamnose mutarotase n=1 Tax=Kockovaella imperatae TaxID=4999 RepID=A0A1Y1UE55_9TREE|nr:rhamnose mutarotase [Kockovaella imperatae]ORX36331.1 rhamnose mutarotase [Kockovaella imperatae]